MAIVYLNGEYLPAEDARVGVGDRGLLQGMGVYETLRAYHGTPFQLRRHLDRLYGSSAALDMPTPLPRDDLDAATREVVRRNGLDDARVRITLTWGAVGGAIPAESSALVTAVPVEGLSPAIYEEGVRVVSTSIDKPVELARHKTTDALPKMLALREAERAGAFEAIFRNPAGRISECATSNIFLVAGGDVATPPVSEGLLPGITRAIVLELCAGLGVPAGEREVENEDLFRADEVFITGSVKEVVPVVRVGDRTIGAGRPGPVTRRLIEAYRAQVRAECGDG